MDYEPLDISQNQIRLLRFQPVEADKPLRGTLTNFSLDALTPQYKQHLAQTALSADRSSTKFTWSSARVSEAGITERYDTEEEMVEKAGTQFWRFTWGDYTALSYTWGEKLASRPIILNGVSVTVTENLEAALRFLYPDGDPDDPFLWVDALCINQNDVAERGREVKRMREIYQNAFSVFSWLGPAAEENDKAIDMLRELADKYRSVPQSESDDPDTHANALLNILLHSSFPPGSWNALYRFLNRAYWKRLWILQEVVMSHQLLVLLCGEQSVYWSDMSVALQILQVNNGIVYEQVEKEQEEAVVEDVETVEPNIFYLLERIQRLHKFALTEQEGEGRQDLMEVMLASRLSEQKDARDKIYGILGLLDPSLVSQLRIDYTLPVLEVYTGFVKAVIHVTKRLDIICQSRADLSTEQAYPSWVPDWQRKIQVVGDLRGYTGPKANFNASGDTTAMAEFSERGQLMCRAFKIDAVDGIGCPVSPNPGGEDDVVQSSQHHHAYSNKEGLDTALWRTLVANRSQSGEPAPDWFRTLLEIPMLPRGRPHDVGDEVIYEIFDSFRECTGTFRIFGYDLASFFPYKSDRELGDATILQQLGVMSRAVNVLFGRKLMTTARGFLGLAPEGLQKGDSLWILLGCSVPVALRSCGDYYKLVGECYVHGVMEGEAMAWVDTGECKLENITLC